jgi:hypothetical protein
MLRPFQNHQYLNTNDPNAKARGLSFVGFFAVMAHSDETLGQPVEADIEAAISGIADALEQGDLAEPYRVNDSYHPSVETGHH